MAYEKIRVTTGAEKFVDIGVTYEYTPMDFNGDIDLPHDPPSVEINKVEIESGDLIDLLFYIDDMDGSFYEWLETYLLDKND